MAARMAMVKASGSIAFMVSKLKSGQLKDGSLLLIWYRSPMVFTFISKIFTIPIPTSTAIRDPGIFSVIKGHTISTARQTTPTRTACQFTVEMLLPTAFTLSMVSMVFVPAG